MCDELGLALDSPPDPPFLVDAASDEMARELARWVAERNGALAEFESATDEPLFELLDAAKSHLQSIQNRPWTSEQIPPLADWLTENDAALDLLVESSQRSHFFSPPPNLLLDDYLPVIDLSLEVAQHARGAVRSLAARAHRLAAGQHQLAWEDAYACWRFGELIGNDHTIVELLIGIASRQVAKDATIAILASETLPKDVAIQIQSDLAKLAPRLDIISAIDFYERIQFIDSILRHFTGRLGDIADQTLTTEREMSAVNMNVPLEQGNLLYDQLASVLAIENWQDRNDALEKIDADLQQRSEKSLSKMALATINRKARSTMMGDIFICLMAPAFQAAADAWERDQANLLLTQLASALAVYRIEHDAYPATLEDLVKAGILSRIPTDPYDQPFDYERRDDGYLLYSWYKNQRDDGGVDLGSPIVDGEWIPLDEFNRPNLDACDIVVRLPLPPLELPTNALAP